MAQDFSLFERINCRGSMPAERLDSGRGQPARSTAARGTDFTDKHYKIVKIILPPTPAQQLAIHQLKHRITGRYHAVGQN